MPSDVPFRLRILHNLTSVLQGITPANGYNYDLSTSVFRGRLIFGDDDPVPMVVINEAPLPDSPVPAKPGAGTWQGPWELMIQGWVDDDKKNPTDPAHMLLADVRKALAIARREAIRPGMGSNLLGMGSRVLDMQINAVLVRAAEQQVQDLANFAMGLTLTIVEKMDDPYA